MSDFIAAAAQMVCGAVVQEMVSRGVSMALGKRKEKASQGQYSERLKKAAKEVEFVLERTAKLPITELSLLRDRFELKRDFIQAACLLISSRNKKRQATQVKQQEMSQQAATGLVTTHNPAAMFSVSSFIAGMSKDDQELLLCLSCDDVERFEQFADSARSILSRVESGCSLRRFMFFPSPLVRHLFDERRPLLYRTVEADQARGFFVFPARLEEGFGIEVQMHYNYLDRKRAEKSFSFWLGLRLSESTDIVGVAMNCLRSLTSQFNFAADTAMGELTLLANLQDFSSHAHAPPWVGMEENHREIIRMCRPNPLCCQASSKGHEPCAIDNVVSSSELSHALVPGEDVHYFRFNCCIVSAPEYSLRSSPTDERSVVMRYRRPALQLGVCLLLHVHDDLPQQSCAVEIIGDNDEEECIDVSIQQVGGEMTRTRAINCFLRRPKVTKYSIVWVAKHGGIAFIVKKLPAAAGVPGPKTSIA